MSLDPEGGIEWAERWDRMFHALSAEPRRAIVISLSEAPAERRLPLPDAAETPNQAMDSETLSNQLRHHHLPLLADAGYVRWSSEPFCVQRGPAFDEAAFITEKVLESVEEIPQSLLDNCRVLPDLSRDGWD
ncbi:DUF7344 domain-containing protein [Halobaculum sp. EA56]|uniref:DUF7344 domain-containing protein n=1 Tax=Halobaculum sp. EA56 TaxID=3421648 RepID=UPI003EBA9527